ncbi:hypothetical protein CEE45_10550 [Candidatus Heimdallarchaeota archaeon B3_Heim]|nr:MAG: hypothetical protein CEE45_10550 [Candidatus Heimdallarchaeota archaeon B3_Heim]
MECIQDPELFENSLERDVNDWIKSFDDKKRFDSLPKLISTKEELIISISLGLWIIKSLIKENDRINNYEPVMESLRFLERKYEKNISLWKFLKEVFSYLADLKQDLSLFTPHSLEIEPILNGDIFGTIVQNALERNYRKKLAANYTTLPSARIICSNLTEKSFTKIIDPFCGSGRLISAYLEEKNMSMNFPSLIWINDLVPSAVVIAYSRILIKLQKHNLDPSILIATIGDAFRRLPTRLRSNSLPFDNDFDLVLMNPPFTRTHRIDDSQRKVLVPLIQKYIKYLIGQPGLHIYSILLADQILKHGGTLSAILPVSTFLSNYSKGIQNYLMSKYEIDSILTSDEIKSFSEGSDFKELILVATKRTSDNHYGIKFSLICGNSIKNQQNISSTRLIHSKHLLNEWNWMRYFHSENILDLRQKLLKTNKIRSGEELDLKIVRGVEMYGPGFFFLPNKIWTQIVKKNEGYELISREEKLILPEKYLVSALRKQSNYQGYITPTIADYALSVSEPLNQLTSPVKTYIRKTQDYANPARKKFKTRWINHLEDQLTTKKPWGYLFFVDKFGLTSATNNVLFLDEKKTASKNFFVLTDKNHHQSKFLGAWLNSSFYFLLFINSRREISGSYGRLQIIDYMREKIFLDISQCSSNDIKYILEAFDILRSEKVKALPDQIYESKRENLDIAIARALGFSETEIPLLIELLYETLVDAFQGIKIRNKKQSMKKK